MEPQLLTHKVKNKIKKKQNKTKKHLPDFFGGIQAEVGSEEDTYHEQKVTACALRAGNVRGHKGKMPQPFYIQNV